MSDEGRLVAGRYRIVQRIGTGAMGAVWQAHDEVLGRTVAIKQLLLQPGLEPQGAEDARQRTMREGRIAARLHHPNAISVFDVVTDDNGQPCLIMEYLNSTSLAQVLQEERTLPPTEVARIGAQVAAALHEAHAVGIVHRDIKPGNILLAPNGTVKITDFGISRAKDDVTVTKTGMIAGTPAYLAPEVAIGGDPGPESDIFSLGSTLYAACEGQPPFGLSENTLSLLHAVAAGQINPPRQSGPLASVLAVLLHPDTDHRPTAEECEELLAAVARGETPLGGPADETILAAPVSDVLGGGVLGAGVTQALDSESAGHSGSLLDDQAQAGQFYDEDDYQQQPASAYPEDDYDGYDNYDETALLSERGHPGGPQPTRAVPLPGNDYDDYDDDYDHQPPPPPPPTRAQTSPADEDDEKPGAWKKPALIGGVVVASLTALAIWLMSSNNPETPAQIGNTSPKPAPTATSDSSTPETTEPPSETESTEATTSSSKKSSTKNSQTKDPDPPTTKTTPKTTTPKTTTPSDDPPSSTPTTTPTPPQGNG